jgi:cysteine-S-conjugate beta-lyase
MDQTDKHPNPDHDLSARLVEAGRKGVPHTPVANTPVYRASTILFNSIEQAQEVGPKTATGERHATSYGTVGTSTTFALMDALAEIEGRGHDTRAALAPSGLAAITTALLAFLKPGDHMLMSDSVYGPARTFANGLLASFGVTTSFFPPQASAQELEQFAQPNTKVLFLESPGSYTLEIHDTPALCAWARTKGIVSMIDNTWATPVFARPFDWGVDLSLMALTKYWSGHSDVLMGAMVVRSEHWLTLWKAVRQLGQCVGGDDAFLILRGLRTAEVRMRQHESSALHIARWLQSRPEVKSVLHPGLPDHPQHALWKRDFLGASGLFSFELQPGTSFAQVCAICNDRKHFGIGYSWGGFESLIMAAQITQLRTINPWTGGPLIRLNIGLEDPATLIADLEVGFARAFPSSVR